MAGHRPRCPAISLSPRRPPNRTSIGLTSGIDPMTARASARWAPTSGDPTHSSGFVPAPPWHDRRKHQVCDLRCVHRPMAAQTSSRPLTHAKAILIGRSKPDTAWLRNTHSMTTEKAISADRGGYFVSIVPPLDQVCPGGFRYCPRRYRRRGRRHRRSNLSGRRLRPFRNRRRIRPCRCL